MTDTFRKVYRELPVEFKTLIIDIKTTAENLENLMKTIPSREMSLALTNLEQSIMWATKAIVVLHDEKTRS